MAFNPSTDTPNDPSGGQSASGNWWEGPPPAGYTGTWPPPLPPGGSYGPNFGQINSGNWPNTSIVGAPTVDQTIAANQNNFTPANVAPTPPAGGTGGGGGGASSTGGGGSLSSLIAPFTGTYTQPGFAPLPSTPSFTPPSYTAPPPFSYQPFTPPSPQEAINDPGYQFRLGQGEQALQQSAAATGTLNTGGTLKDILGYGQNYASNEYQNVWNRDLSAYQTNYNTAANNYATNYKSQYTDPYAFAYQNATSAFAPQMTGYQTQAANIQHQNDINQSTAWNQYLQNYNVFRNQQLDTFNKQFQTATAG